MSLINNRFEINNCIETAYEYDFDFNPIRNLYNNEIKAPNELKSFIHHMFTKYNFILPNELLLEELFIYSLEYIDVYDPFFLIEKSNIKENENKYYFQYRANTEVIHYFDPNEFNTYERKDYDYDALHYAYLNPWFNVNSIINDPEFSYHDPENYLCHERAEDIKELMSKFNIIDFKQIELIFNSILIWFISPEPGALKFRNNIVPIINSCSEYGEGIIFYDSSVLNPTEYIKMNIPTHVCVICNQRLPCSKFIRDSSDNLVYFCRHHINININNINIIMNDIDYNYEGECRFDCSTCTISECAFSRNKISLRDNRNLDLRFMIAKEIVKKKPELKSNLKLSIAIKGISRPKFLK